MTRRGWGGPAAGQSPRQPAAGFHRRAVSRPRAAVLAVGVLAAGSSLSNFKDGQVLRAQSDPATGRGAQKVTLRGSVWIKAGTTDVTLGDLTFQGYGDKANIIFLRGDRTHVRYSAVTASHASHPCPVPPCGQMGIAIGDNATGWTIERSKIFGNGLSPRFDHGIYCASARGGTVEGNWIYDNASYGLHWYPDCDGTDVRYNVVDDNGNGMVFAGEGADHSDRNVLRNGIISNSTTGEPGLPVHCSSPGIGNAARDMDLAGTPTDDCSGSELARSNIISADPLYVNRAGRDYRLRAGSPAARLMGEFATAVPGPRT